MRHSRLAAAIYLAVVLAGGALVAGAHRDDERLAISVLGAGTRLSVLVTVGNASLLIAGGDDASAFANAVARARPFFANRVDVLILAGDRGDLPAVSRAVGEVAYRRVYVLDGPLRAHLADLGLSTEHLVSRPVSIALPGDVIVTLDPGPVRSGSPPAWSATIDQDDSRVAVVAGAGTAPAGADVAVVAGRLDEDGWLDLRTPLLVVPATLDGVDVSAGLTESPTRPDWMVRISAGDVARLRLVDGGVEVPRDARSIVPLASPEANSLLGGSD